MSSNVTPTTSTERCASRDSASEIVSEQRFSSAGNPYLYAGRRLDPETEFFYFRHRYYDAEVGRFLQRDPMGMYYDGLNHGNAYTYVGNSPYSYSDPMGLGFGVDSWILLAAGIFEGAVSAGVEMVTGLADLVSDLGNPFKAIDTVKGLWQGMKGLIDQILGGDLGQAAKALLGDLYDKIMRWKCLSDHEKGELIGKLLAEKGIGMLGAGAAAVGAKMLNNLRKASKAFKKVDKPKSKGASKAEREKVDKEKKGCGCFAAGTAVMTEDGVKSIEDVEAGDRVLARSDETGEQAFMRVLQTFVTDVPEIYHVIYKHPEGEVVRELVTTAAHPFWVVQDGAWVKGESLRPGDRFVLSDGALAEIEEIIVERGPPGEIFTTYNFEVEGFHTLFRGAGRCR